MSFMLPRDALPVLGGLGFLLLGVDAFVTLFSTRGAGPLTHLWTTLVWRAMLLVHRRKPIHRFLALVGPLMMPGVILVWMALLWVSWAGVFFSVEGAVENSTTHAPASPMYVLYFLGATLSSVGYGDYVPSGPPWTQFAGLATTSMSILVTATLSYLLPVVSASIERRALAERIRALGDTPEEMVRTAWAGEDAGALDGQITDLLNQVDFAGQRLLVYPILHFFHEANPDRALSRSVLHLADALHLGARYLDHPGRPAPSRVRLAEHALEVFARNASRLDGGDPEAEVPGAAQLAQAGLPVRAEPLAAPDYPALRGKLVAACRGDGWEPS